MPIIDENKEKLTKTEIIIPNQFIDIELKIIEQYVKNPMQSMASIADKIGCTRAWVHEVCKRTHMKDFMNKVKSKRRELLEEGINEANIAFQKAIPQAVREMYSLLDCENYPVKYKAAEFILSNKSIFEPYISKEDKVIQTKEEMELELQKIADIQGITLAELKEIEGIE